MTEPSTAQDHPFILDLLAGWMHRVGDTDQYNEAYHQAVYDLYQKAGRAWDDEPGERGLTLREQIRWLRLELKDLVVTLEAIEGPIHTPAPVEDQDDDTDFGEERECEVLLTDWVRLDATAYVTARSKKEAAEKAVALAEDDNVDWDNSWESQGETEVDSVTVQ